MVNIGISSPSSYRIVSYRIVCSNASCGPAGISPLPTVSVCKYLRRSKYVLINQYHLYVGHDREGKVDRRQRTEDRGKTTN